jgi:hypothetical protein
MHRESGIHYSGLNGYQLSNKKKEASEKDESEDEGEKTMKEYRVRISNYGKWYLPPDTFNRNFDLLKNA